MAAEVELLEVEIETSLVAFDGRVLEVFGTAEGSWRAHIGELLVALDREDRKGRRRICFYTAKSGGVVLTGSAEQQPGLRDLLAALGYPV